MPSFSIKYHRFDDNSVTWRVWAASIISSYHLASSETVRCKGASQILGAAAICLPCVFPASNQGKSVAEEFVMSYPNITSMPHRSSRGLKRSAQVAPPQSTCDKSATGTNANNLIQRSIIRSWKHMKIGTWNVRTMLAPGSARLLAAELDRVGVSIMALQEVRSE